MKPYYEQDGIVIYHGDCREILPQLGPVPLALTDPPYGIDLEYGHKDDWRPDRAVWALVRAAIPYGSLHCTVSNRHLAFWMDEIRAGGWDYQHCSVYWNRCRAGGNGNGRFAFAWEPILHFGEVGALEDRMMSDVWPHVGKRETDHPAERDMGTWRGLLRLLPGETVLDPFMGSGTTLRAAKDLGRKAIGIEIEERYCEIAAKRMAQGVLL